ncbi:hypothetical protein [Paracidovorax avenae]|uniref:hypothetical protein n=1 Tax=Paracidovorax avenae TaxID=80867 RepID=UPI0012603230|nr:hypothetical protein [Paracidovorax avenae]
MSFIELGDRAPVYQVAPDDPAARPSAGLHAFDVLNCRYCVVVPQVIRKLSSHGLRAQAASSQRTHP